MTEAFKAGFIAYMEKYGQATQPATRPAAQPAAQPAAPIVKRPIYFGKPFTRDIKLDPRISGRRTASPDVTISVRRKPAAIMEEPPVVGEKIPRAKPVLAEDPLKGGTLLKRSSADRLLLV